MKDEPRTYREGFEKGQEAVRCKPYVAPKNPFKEDDDPDAYNGWEDGAIEAGIGEIYTNGHLDRGTR